jgi:ribosomal 50S subunit-recycling heat shock protein
MRLDKYLKVSRIFKRRTVAKQIAGSGKISVNGRTAKPSQSLEVGDVIDIDYADKSFKVKVKELRKHASKDHAANMYDVLSEDVK